MKKMIVTACVAIASAVAIADAVQSSNTFGVLKVATGCNGTNKKQFVVPVTWEAVGTAGTAIAPTDLVLASNLIAGDTPDRLYASQGGSLGAWKVIETDGVKSWSADPVSNTSVTPRVDYAAGSVTSIARGNALVVETAADAIYLSGQYASTASAVTIAAATTDPSDGKMSATFTLIGGHLAKDIDLNTDVTFSEGIAKGDEIRLSLNDVYTYNSKTGKWQKPNGTENVAIDGEVIPVTTYTTDGVIIPQGQGAWYVRKATSSITMTFKASE